MRRSFAIAGLVAVLSLGGGAALAFQETPAPPPAASAEGVRPATPPAMQLGTPGAAADMEADKGVKLFGYSILPKLDFGLDLLYGQEQQPLELQGQGSTLEENGDVTVLGKVKRRF